MGFFFIPVNFLYMRRHKLQFLKAIEGLACESRFFFFLFPFEFLIHDEKHKTIFKLYKFLNYLSTSLKIPGIWGGGEILIYVMLTIINIKKLNTKYEKKSRPTAGL